MIALFEGWEGLGLMEVFTFKSVDPSIFGKGVSIFSIYKM